MLIVRLRWNSGHVLGGCLHIKWVTGERDLAYIICNQCEVNAFKLSN